MDKIKTDIYVLDADICTKCKLMDIRSDYQEIFGDGRVVATTHNTYCNRVNECRYLKNLFESASETSPKVEEAKAP